MQMNLHNPNPSMYDILHHYTEGEKITKLLHNRGRSRMLLSRLLTKVSRNELQKIKSGTVILPTESNPDLPAISLTSWPPRYGSLPLVLLNLLSQDLIPSRIHVWIASEDYNYLDKEIVSLFEESIVVFHTTHDFGPHKKWLPHLLEFETPFVICDDDIFYPRSWYRCLVESDDDKACVGHRCHKLKLSENEDILPYQMWEKDADYSGESSHLLTAIGCGGVIIYPHRISKTFRDWSLISELCPMSDDTWLKLAHIDSKIPYKKTRYYFPYIDYDGSQKVSLMRTNVDLGQKDKMLKKSLDNLDIDLSVLTSET